MRKKYNESLDKLNGKLIYMASLVESNIELSVDSFVNKDMAMAKEVIKRDLEINKVEKEIENMAIDLILRQQPVAKDLRKISAILKMITDLERIGDYSKDISEITIELYDESYIKEIIDIKKMKVISLNMVKLSIDAFINEDIDIAKKVINLDEEVNSLYDVIKKDLISLSQKDSKNGKQALLLFMISKYLERIADHAQNIGEWVIYLCKGEIV